MLHVFLVDLFFVLSTVFVFKKMLKQDDDLESRSAVIMSFVLAAAIGVAVLGFLLFHTYLLLTNQTTIEFISSQPTSALRESATFRKNPFDLGRRANWNQVFGEQGRWRWAFSFIHQFEEEQAEFPTIGIRHKLEADRFGKE